MRSIRGEDDAPEATESPRGASTYPESLRALDSRSSACSACNTRNRSNLYTLLMPPAPDWFWIVSPLILIAGWFVVNAITSKRELNNWRRTTLTNAVSSMIEASNKRRSLVGKIENARERPKDLIEEQEHLMLTASQQIEICMAEDVSRFCTAIELMHKRSNIAIYALQEGWGSDNGNPVSLLNVEEIRVNVKAAHMDTEQLTWYHNQLIRQLQIELGLRKFEFNPDHAQVLNRKPNRKIRLPARLRKWIYTKRSERSYNRSIKKLPSVKP